MFIEVKNARKEYGTGDALVKALDDVSLSMEEGKIYVVLGASGSGKSTFMNMLGGLDTLQSGDITVNGKKLAQLSKKEMTAYRRETVGFVFQSYNLIPDLTAVENVQTVADIAKQPLDVKELMESLEIGALADRFPKELSGGQQQRVAIARAMVKNPKLLLCDELTGALDTKSSGVVLEQVFRMNEKYGTTVVIITHNQAIAEMSDVIIRLRDGKVVSVADNDHKKTVAELAL